MRLAALGLCLVMLACGSCSLSPSLEATAGEPADHWSNAPAAVPIMKIGRGVTNILVSPADIPMTVVRRWNEADSVGGCVSAVVVGTGEGVCNAVVRIGAGVAEILSFPLYRQTEPLYERDLGESVFGAGDK